MFTIVNKTYLYKIFLLSAFLTLFVPQISQGQHNGNPLLFQGLTDRNSVAVKSLAYGNAYVSRSGELNSLFYNTSGLANIQTIQVSIGMNSKNLLERDNQNFYPGNEYLNTSVYLEGLLTPDPAWNGLWNDSLETIWYDSLGNPQGAYWDADKIQKPIQGKDNYSKEAADNEHTSKGFSLDQISIAVPFQLAGKHVVAAVTYFRQYDVHDYDWNGANLDLHWGTSTIIQAKEGDTTRTNWSVFNRKRSGGIYSIAAALALQLNKHVQLGMRLNRFSGETNDKQTLDRVGYFLTLHQLTKWSFSYDTNNTQINGTSKFSAMNLNMGALFVNDNFNFGMNVQLPYTIKRQWEYSTQISSLDFNASYDSSGVDRVKMPAIYALGMTIKPGKGLTLSFDYENTRLNQAEYNLDKSNYDSLTIYSKWVNQVALRFGVEYRVTEYLAIMGGYQSQGTPFIPYGVAIRDQGPPGESYSIGLSLNIFHSRFDLAYTIYQLKYYDAYMTNRNFTLEQFQRVSFGYTLFL